MSTVEAALGGPAIEVVAKATRRRFTLDYPRKIAQAKSGGMAGTQAGRERVSVTRILGVVGLAVVFAPRLGGSSPSLTHCASAPSLLASGSILDLERPALRGGSHAPGHGPRTTQRRQRGRLSVPWSRERRH